MRTSSIKHPESINDLLTLTRSEVIRSARTGLFCLLRFGFVETFGFSAYLLSALEFTRVYPRVYLHGSSAGGCRLLCFSAGGSLSR